LRFAHAMSSLPEPVLEHLLSLKPSQTSEIALVAEVPDLEATGQIVGITRCIGEADNHRCEFSLSVSDDYHGEGVGSQLILDMMKQAHAKGFTEVYGYVLIENQNMLELMKHLGFKISPMESDSDFKLVTHTV
jgi:acetyltransferase